MKLITPDLGLVFWMTLSFIILLFILTKFAWKPIIKSLKQREEKISDALSAAEQAHEAPAGVVEQRGHDLLLQDQPFHVHEQRIHHGLEA